MPHSALTNLGESFVGHVTFPLTNYLMNRRHVMRKYRDLLRSEQFSRAELEQSQLANLQRTLVDAQRYSPFYAQRFREAGIDPLQVQSVEDLRCIPPLTRDMVTAHRREMVDVRQQHAIDAAERSTRPAGQPIPWARFRKNRLIRDASSGSTGTPAIFYEDGTSTAMNWAHELRLKQWFGIGPGVGEARFSRIASQFLPNTAVLKWRWRLWHHLVLPGNNLSDADHEYSWRQLLAFRPRILFGVTSALTGLANFLERRNLTSEMYPIDLVITWAGPAYDHDVQKLQRIFQAPVSNIYSSRELGHIACRCPAGRLHVNEENYLVEIEPLRRSEESSSSLSGSPGEILVTPLFPLPMPFIRYRTGDIGQWSLSECPCGRKQRVIDKLLGRSREVFRTDDGRMIAPNFWCHVFMQPEVCDGLEDFQVVLRAGGAICFRIVRTASYTDLTERIIRDFVLNNLSPTILLEFEYVSGIEPHPSGKFQMVVAESPGILHENDPVEVGV